MIVQCTKCSTKFKIADEKIGASGVKVRCSKCRHMFLVKKSGAEEIDSIFSSPTRAAPPPAPAPLPTPAPAFPIPAPPIPPPPQPPKPAAKPATGNLDVDLFADLDGLPAGPPPALAGLPPAASPAYIPGVVPANAPDDPFSGIDLDAPALAGPPSTLPPPPSLPQGGDLFGKLGDPFAVSPAAPTVSPAKPAAPPVAAAAEPFSDPFAAPPPAPSPPASESSGLPQADPFASLDISSPAPGGSSGDRAGEAMAGMLSRSDPFGEAADASGQEDAPSGLQLDMDGKLTEPEAPPPAPRPAPPMPVQTKLEAPSPTAKTVEYDVPPPGQFAPLAPSPATKAYKIAFGALAAALALLLFVVYRSGGKPDLTSWHTYAHAFGLAGSQPVATGSLQIELRSNTTYRNRDGHEILVARGQLVGLDKTYPDGIAVTLSVLDKNQQVVAKKTYPAGVLFSPAQVYDMLGAPAVDEAYGSAVAASKHLTPLDKGRLPFMVLLFDHPSHLEDFQLHLEAEPAKDHWTALGPPPQPEAEPKDGRPELQPVPAKPVETVRTHRVSGDVIRLAPDAGQPRSP